MSNRKPKLGSPLGPESLVPKDIGDPLAVVRHQARQRLLGAVAESCPEVPSTLKKEIFLQFVDQVRRTGETSTVFEAGTIHPLLEVSWGPWQAFFSVGPAIERWQDQFNLRETDSKDRWILGAAWATLDGWRVLGFSEPLHFRLTPIPPRLEKEIERRSLPDWPLAGRIVYNRPNQPNSEAVRFLSDHGYEVIDVITDDGGRVLGTSLKRKEVPFEFRFNGLDPLGERRSAWRRRCESAFKMALKEYERKRTEGLSRAPQKLGASHFRWAALYLCGRREDGSFGLSCREIADRENASSRTTIQNGVKDVLTLAGVRPPIRKGRRPGS